MTKTDLEGLLARAKATYKTQKRAFPKAGTAEYQSLQTQAVAFLVQRAEYDNRAAELKLTVTDKEIDARIDQVKKQSFGGSQAKLDKQLKEQGYTKESLRADIKAQLLSEKIYDAVTKDAKVTDAEIAKYYQQNKSQYSQAESRDVRHILVKTKAQANKIYDMIKAGGNFAALAKKYSTDPGSKDNGGKLTIIRGQTVAPFDTTAFLLSTNQVSRPIKTQYGYHVIQPISADQAGEGDAAQGRQARDPGDAPRQGEDGRDHQVDGRHQELLRQEGLVRDRVRPARGSDRLGDDHRLTPCLRRAMEGSPRRSSTCRS